MSYLATGLHLLLRLLWLRLLGNHGRCHILSCVLRAHRLLIGEPQRQRKLQRTVGCGSETLRLWCWLTWLLMDDLRCDVISTAETDWRPGVLRSPWIFIWDAENTKGTNVFNWIIVFVLTYCVDLHVGSDTAVWEDLRELRDDAEGVRLWLKRSRTSFRLEVLSWDSEPESWDCCDGMRTCELQYNTDSPQHPGTVSPSLPSSQVGILLYRALCVALLSPQHNWRVKMGNKLRNTHPLYMMDYYGLIMGSQIRVNVTKYLNRVSLPCPILVFRFMLIL